MLLKALTGLALVYLADLLGKVRAPSTLCFFLHPLKPSNGVPENISTDSMNIFWVILNIVLLNIVFMNRSNPHSEFVSDCNLFPYSFNLLMMYM